LTEQVQLGKNEFERTYTKPSAIPSSTSLVIYEDMATFKICVGFSHCLH